MCLKSFCPLVAQSALTCWAIRNVILRRSQLTRMCFYMGTEDSTSHESLNTSTEGANKSQAAAVGAAFWGAVRGDEAVPWGKVPWLAGSAQRGSDPSNRPWTGQRF